MAAILCYGVLYGNVCEQGGGKCISKPKLSEKTTLVLADAYIYMAAVAKLCPMFEIQLHICNTYIDLLTLEVCVQYLVTMYLQSHNSTHAKLS